MLSKSKSPIPATVDGYIAGFSDTQKTYLEAMRRILKAALPKAEERISYQMPSYWQEGVLVYFGAWKTHIGLYPASSGLGAFAKELARYVQTRGSIHFPYDEPLPKSLITRIAKFRVEENLLRRAAKKKTGTAKKRLPDPLLARLSGPARRALESIGVGTAKQLSRHAETEILSLHGMGPASMPLLRTALKTAGLAFKKG